MTREEFATYLNDLHAEYGDSHQTSSQNAALDPIAALADDCLRHVYDHVQWCRENGETDLRGILNTIKILRNQLQKIEPQPK